MLRETAETPPNFFSSLSFFRFFLFTYSLSLYSFFQRDCRRKKKNSFDCFIILTMLRELFLLEFSSVEFLNGKVLNYLRVIK